MSKAKKIFLNILLTVLTLLVLANSLVLYILWTSIPHVTEVNPLDDVYYEIDDVKYIRGDISKLDPQKIEQGQIKSHSGSEIAKASEEAVAKRDERNKANSSAN